MGRVIVAARIESIGHFALVERDFLATNQVPSVEVSDAVVDPSVLTLCMPTSFVQQLDLMLCSSRTERIVTTLPCFGVHAPIRSSVQGRECTSEVVELPDDWPVLIDRIPLQLLDLVIDPFGECSIGNPAHGGEQMIEMYPNSELGGIEWPRN